jgi:hypothetical protein
VGRRVSWKRETRGHWQLRIGPLSIVWLTKQAAVALEPDVKARWQARDILEHGG